MAEGAVLVIGGCGFVGFHVVKALLEEETWPSVHVMSRKPARNQLDKLSFDYIDEPAPMATITSKLNYYGKSKTLADQYVLDSNNKSGLRTTCLRVTSVHGPRDNQMIPGAIQALHDGHHRKQIGDNTNLYNACSV